MRKKILIIFVLLLLPFVSILMAGSPEGQLINTMVPAPSLKNNIFGIPLEQKVAIYLPPSYQDSLNRFPVVYFLPGFSSPVPLFYQLGSISGIPFKRINGQVD